MSTRSSPRRSLLFALPNEIRRDLKARDGKDSGNVRHDASFSESARFTERRSRLPA